MTSEVDIHKRFVTIITKVTNIMYKTRAICGRMYYTYVILIFRSVLRSPSFKVLH